MAPATDPNRAKQVSPFTRRYVALAAILGIWMAAGASRLAFLQVVQYRDWMNRAQRQQQRTIEVSPKRGVIYDRNFRELAMSVSVDSVFAVPVEIPNPENTVQLLARVLNVDAAELAARMHSSRSFCWVKRKVDSLEAERVKALNLKGVYLQKENKRFYPKRELAAHVLGYVGMDENGLAGIELALDKSVRGRPGKLLIQTDARQRWYGRTERPPDAGESVVLTIDEKIQYIVERELTTAFEATHSKAAMAVAMDPNTGEVLAMATRPTFNPNTYAQTPPEHWMNRAIAAAFEPGSTFKIITIAGALEEKVTRPSEVIDCQMGAIYVAGHRIRDHKPFGMLSVAHVLAKSSDVGTIKLGLRLGDERFYRYIRGFGFGAPTGIELPGEARGLTKPAERWSKISIGAISMGQEVGITAMQLVSAVAAVANGGTLYRPRILKDHFRAPAAPQPPGMAYAASRNEVGREGRRALSGETALEMRRMMRMVVEEGTGKKAQLNGWTAAGKTGTAQKADPLRGGYSKTDYIASFVGFAPAQNPVIVVAVILDSPRGEHGGGAVSAPVFKRIAEQILPYMDVPRDGPSLPEKQQRELDVAQLDDLAPPEEEVPLTPAPAPWRIPMALPPENAQTVVVDLDNVLVAPDFTGKALRAVAEQAVSLGIDVELVGSGIARLQSPLAGTRLPPGTRMTIRFE